MHLPAFTLHSHSSTRPALSLSISSSPFPGPYSEAAAGVTRALPNVRSGECVEEEGGSAGHQVTSLEASVGNQV